MTYCLCEIVIPTINHKKITTNFLVTFLNATALSALPLPLAFQPFTFYPPTSQKLLPPPIPPPLYNLPAPYLKLPHRGGKECQKRGEEVRKKPMPPPAQFKIALGRRPNSAKYFSKSPLVGVHIFFLHNPLST